MFTVAILLSALAATASASPFVARQDDTATAPATSETTVAEPITIGQFSFPHGSQIVAWNPAKSTLADVCKGLNETRTVLTSTNNGYPTGKLCGENFSLGDQSVHALLCRDGYTFDSYEVSGVATDGPKSHDCMNTPLTIPPYSCGQGASVSQMYVCQWMAFGPGSTGCIGGVHAWNGQL